MNLKRPVPHVPVPRGPLPVLPEEAVHPPVSLSIDGRHVQAPSGSTILEACRLAGISIPTLCFLETLTPVNVCRICVVEVEGSRTLVPACSRKVEPGMAIETRSERVIVSRRMVLELLASAMDPVTAPALQEYMSEYGASTERFPHATERVEEPAKIDNELYVRLLSRCILCYRCVEACGADAQNTFAIAVAGRGFGARIATEFDVPLPESACVYCGNCIAVCPTGALMFRSEFDLRESGQFDPSRQSTQDTICGYCGVGCTLTLHVQDNRIFRVGSPLDNAITAGNLCIKGRFGWQYLQTAPECAAGEGENCS